MLQSDSCSFFLWFGVFVFFLCLGILELNGFVWILKELSHKKFSSFDEVLLCRYLTTFVESTPYSKLFLTQISLNFFDHFYGFFLINWLFLFSLIELAVSILR